MTSTAVERLAFSLGNFLKQIDEHCNTLSKIQQLFGFCIVTPKSPYVPVPTNEIRAELENRAKEKLKQLGGVYLQYFFSPLMPVPEENKPQKLVSVDDYQLTYGVPQFDQKWQQAVSARNLIYCPLDPELYDYLNWFELQEEAIRLVPLIHQTVKELDIASQIKRELCLSAMSVFEAFIYNYGLNDFNFPLMSPDEQEMWQAKKLDWKDRYSLVLPIIKPAKTVHDLYVIARKKAASSRNLMLKELLWAFVDKIEKTLIVQTSLPEEIKSRLLGQLRRTKKRAIVKGKYNVKKRPAISISDIECGQMLYLMIIDYLTQNDRALAEAIFFIWIAQHGAFSDQKLTIEGILTIKMTDIDIEAMTIRLQKEKIEIEIDITDGLTRMLSDWIGTAERKNQRKFFQKITNDFLEDIITYIPRPKFEFS